MIKGTSEGAVTSGPLGFRPTFVPGAFACVQYVSVNLANNLPASALNLTTGTTQSWFDDLS